jgi:hypothetical protein
MTTTEQATGRQLREDGVAANLAAATAVHRSFREHAEQVLARYIRHGALFTADDIRQEIPDGVEPHSANVLPSLIGVYAARGVITPVGWAVSTRRSRHASHNRLWRGSH